MDARPLDVYGPGATSERADAVATALHALGDKVASYARACVPTACVLFGAREHLAPILGDPTDAHPPWACQVTDRRWLVERLFALGRDQDAVKVIAGPPGPPQPAGTRLLVCAIDTMVAVAWSEPTTAREEPAP